MTSTAVEPRERYRAGYFCISGDSRISGEAVLMLAIMHRATTDLLTTRKDGTWMADAHTVSTAVRFFTSGRFLHWCELLNTAYPDLLVPESWPDGVVTAVEKYQSIHRRSTQ